MKAMGILHQNLGESYWMDNKVDDATFNLQRARDIYAEIGGSAWRENIAKVR